MKNHFKEYTNRELELISKLTQEGVTQAKIAIITGRTHEAVKSAVKRFKLSKNNEVRVYSDFEKAIILSQDKLRIAGKLLGMTGSRVSTLRFRLKKKQIN